MDLVYICGPRVGGELRHSLRSVANLPHDRVWIAGHKPDWCVNVRHLPTRQRSTKHVNSMRNLMTALDCPDVSDPFVLMNDDFFVMQPIQSVSALHAGPMADIIDWYRERHRSQYLWAMVATRDLLVSLGHTDPLGYDLHVPMVLDKAALHGVLEVGASVPRVHYRSLYGNLQHVGGERSDDPKVYSRDDAGPIGPFLSTNDTTWLGLAGDRVRAAFPVPSPYELI